MNIIQKLVVAICAIMIHGSLYCQTSMTLTPQANKKGLFGYVNNEGKFVIKAKYVEANSFGKDALAIVAVKKGEQKLYGVIDVNGKFVIEPQFTKMGNFNESSKAVVEILSDDGMPLQGVINKHGDFVISPIYKSINNNWFYLYDEPRIPIKVDESYLNKYGKAFICVSKNGKKGVISPIGNIIVPCNYDSIEYFFDCYIAIKDNSFEVYRYSTSAEPSLIGVFDKVQKVIETPTTSYLIVKRGVNFGYIDCKGYALPCIYKAIKKLEGLCDSNTFSVLTSEGLYGVFVGSGINTMAVPTICSKIYKSFERDIVVEHANGESVFNFATDFSAKIETVSIKHILRAKDGGVYFCSSDGEKIDNIIYSNGKGIFSNKTDYEFVSRMVKYAKLSFADLSETFTNSLKIDDSYLKKLRDITDVSLGVEESIGFDFGGKLEVESEGNIYTYDVAFKGRDESIYFFVSGTNRNGNLWQMNIGNEIYNAVHINMNAIKIRNKIASLRDCLWDLNLQRAQVITPKNYYINKLGKYVVSYVVKYSDDVPDVVYTQPKYVVMGGQLIEVNSGVNYIEKFKDVGYVSIIDPNTMKVEKTILIKESSANDLRSYKGNGYYCYSSRRETTILADHQRPLYKLNNDLSIEYKIEFDEGETIDDFIEIDKTLYLCGATENKGYIGFFNPLLIVIDLETKEVKKISSKLQERKGKYFCKIEGIVKGNLLLTHTDGKKEYMPLSNIKRTK